MKGLAGYLRLSVGIVTISSYVFAADVYHFDTSGIYTSEYCTSHEIGVGAAASAIACAIKCGTNVLCRGFVYENDTMSCKEVHINTFPDRRCLTGSGEDYYVKKVPECDKFLISGTDGVENNQLSESSNWCDVVGIPIGEPACYPLEDRYTSAVFVRLDSLGWVTGSWIAGNVTTTEYVQVDFLGTRMVSKIVLQARDPSAIHGSHEMQYVTSFKIWFSDDCYQYKDYTDGNGASVILTGNSDEHETITRDLPEKIEARCFRINPMTWAGTHISMRFDLKGCL